MGIDFSREGNEHRVGWDVCGLQHGGKQSVLVLAIAVLIFENVGSGMWLIAAEAKGEADIANIFGDVIVEGRDRVELGRAALDEVLRSRADFWRWVRASFFKIGVRGGDLRPAV